MILRVVLALNLLTHEDWRQIMLDFRVLCQKNEGSVKIKQRPVKMGGRTTYRTLSPKRAPFQIGID
jgi:hypothetical protein